MGKTALLAALGCAALTANAQRHWDNPTHDRPDHGRPWKPWKGHQPWKPTGTSSVSYSPTGTSATSDPTGTSSGLPLVDSEALQASISESTLSTLAHELEDLAYSTPLRNREMGSEGYQLTIDWITSYLDEMSDYYKYEVQPFEALYSHSEGNFSIDGVDQDAAPFEYTASGTASAELVPVTDLGCVAADFPDTVSGNIALISRGECEFGLKSALAGAAGAVGAVIYNNIPGEIGGGTLGEPPRPEGAYVATVGISQEAGEAIIASIDAGETVVGDLSVEASTYNITTHNVIAQSIGGDADSVLTLGAHADSVYAGPGINDDGSGTIGLIAVAQELASYSTPNAVRFCWWGGEEFGLLGSTHYVSTLSNASAEQIKLYLNFDMIASPNYIYGIYDGDGSAFNISGPPGSDAAEAFFESWFASQGLNSTPTEFSGRSDYGPFLERGIASGGLFTGAEENKTEEWAELFGGTAGIALDPNYHAAGDNYSNLNFEAFVTNTKAIAAAVAEYGTSFESLGAAKVKRHSGKRLGAKGVHGPQAKGTHMCGKHDAVHV